jgi:hypothetical protein
MRNLLKFVATIVFVLNFSCSSIAKNSYMDADPLSNFSSRNKQILEDLIKKTAVNKKQLILNLNNNIYSTTYNGSQNNCDLVALTVQYANTNYNRTENYLVCDSIIKNIGSNTIPSTVENDPVVKNQISYILQSCKAYGSSEVYVPNKDLTIRCIATDTNRCYLELTFINSRGILLDKQIIKSCR